MKISSEFKKYRDMLQQGIYAVINPFVKWMIKIGITPNIVTTIGLVGNIAAAGIFAYAGYKASQTFDPHYGLVALAGAVIILFSLFDMLDGQVARLGNMTTRFGALYDSVLDRYCELLTLGGITYYLFCIGFQWGALITFLAMIGSVMVSYVRARAEGIGIECKVGFMQRPERVVVTALASIIAGLVGMGAGRFEDTCAPYILIGAMALIALLANLTAIVRVLHCRKALNQ